MRPVHNFGIVFFDTKTYPNKFRSDGITEELTWVMLGTITGIVLNINVNAFKKYDEEGRQVPTDFMPLFMEACDARTEVIFVGIEKRVRKDIESAFNLDIGARFVEAKYFFDMLDDPVYVRAIKKTASREDHGSLATSAAAGAPSKTTTSISREPGSSATCADAPAQDAFFRFKLPPEAASWSMDEKKRYVNMIRKQEQPKVAGFRRGTKLQGGRARNIAMEGLCQKCGDKFHTSVDKYNCDGKTFVCSYPRYHPNLHYV